MYFFSEVFQGRSLEGAFGGKITDKKIFFKIVKKLLKFSRLPPIETIPGYAPEVFS